MGEKKRKRKFQLSLRLNLLFLAIFLLFSALIFRLGFVQIVYGDEYKRVVDKTEDIVISTTVPRGEIYDRNGNSIVSNKGKNAILFTNWKYKPNQLKETAGKLADLIDMDSDKELKKITDIDKQDYWLLLHPKQAEKKVTAEEDGALKEKYGSKEYQKKFNELLRERVTNEEVKSLTAHDLETLAIYRLMSSGYYYAPLIIKNDGVTDEELAKVSENLSSMPGVDTAKDWDRTYQYGDTLKTVLGKVSSTQKGIPAEQKEEYLAKGYNMNDRVGLSYIEKQYEDVLRGKKQIVEYVRDKKDQIVSSNTVSPGKAGSDLYLSIDMNLQLEVEKIIEEELKKTKAGYAGTQFLDRAFVVLMDPHTGEVLTMAGKQLAKDDKTGKQEVQDFALGNITTSYNVGSAVKGAMVLTGYKEGVIHPYSTMLDEVMRVKKSPDFKSWTVMNTINDLQALQRSSNVYMAKTAIAIGKGHYVAGQPLDVNPQAYTTIRNSFGEMGLGVRTNIDLPNEMTGFKGEVNPNQPGNLMFLSIGQYDTYTNMQLAQYVSTIANGGYRIQPHIVKEIRSSSKNTEKYGVLEQEIKPVVLNKLDMKEEWMNQVQKGFRMVMQPGGTGSVFAGASYTPAGKTGTAQAFYDGPERDNYKEPPQVMNVSLVSYAPYENPEVAMAVMVPWVYTTANGPSPNLTIGKRVMDKYFEMKKD